MLTLKQLQELKSEGMSGPNRLRRVMEITGATQEQISSGTGLRQPQISAIMNGRYSKLPIETARKIAGYFGMHIEDLFPARDEHGAVA